jgi:hypothetical protein
VIAAAHARNVAFDCLKSSKLWSSNAAAILSAFVVPAADEAGFRARCRLRG